MAQKRMFDKALIDTDRFMDLGMPAKALYFLLGMEADDEGFVSYKKVMKVHGGNEDDLKILVFKGFVIKFPSGVVVITDWNSNNWLDSRRMRPTEYQNEKKMLILTPHNKYELSNGLASIEERSRVESSRDSEPDGSRSKVKESQSEEREQGTEAVQEPEEESNESTDPAGRWLEDSEGVQIWQPSKAWRDSHKKLFSRAKVFATSDLAPNPKKEKIFNYPQELEALSKSWDKKLKIIALYFHEKQFSFENKEQFELALKREFKPAKSLIGYNAQQLMETFAYVDRRASQEGYNWTLETVIKSIAHIVNK